MKQAILRNIAIVSALFIVSFSVMLITNYFQVKGSTPLQTEIMETLKEINDRNADNQVLQEQIRQLDLLARKAYFVRMDSLMTGVHVLLGMFSIFVICTRLYFARDKNIPGKKTAPVDEWIVKTKARKYVIWVASGIVMAAVLFALCKTLYLAPSRHTENAVKPEITAALHETENAVEEAVDMQQSGTEAESKGDTEAPEEVSSNEVAPTETLVVETVSQPVVSTVTHNAFRGNNANGISTARGLPMKWDLSKGTNIAWKKEIPRKGYNSPVINGNKVFFSGADEQARELYCYDLTTGNKLWSLAANHISGSPAQMPKTTNDTGLAASGVATNGSQVCAIFATGDIVCADMEGKQLWAKNLGVPVNHYGYASSLLIYGNSVIIQYDNQNSPKVVSLNLATGAVRWSKNREEKVTWSSPMIASINQTPQLILMGNPGITAYNPNNGEQLWRVECMSGEVGASACSSNGIIFGASEYAKLIAIDGNNGSVLWENNEFLPEVSSPVATKDNLYLATSYGVIAAFDTQTGELRKSHELNTEFYSSPMIAEGKIYLFSNDGKVYIFSANNELNLIQSFETGEKTFATPAFTDGKIVVRTEKSIYCVSTQS